MMIDIDQLMADAHGVRDYALICTLEELRALRKTFEHLDEMGQSQIAPAPGAPLELLLSDSEFRDVFRTEISVLKHRGLL